MSKLLTYPKYCSLCGFSTLHEDEYLEHLKAHKETEAKDA